MDNFSEFADGARDVLRRTVIRSQDYAAGERLGKLTRGLSGGRGRASQLPLSLPQTDPVPQTRLGVYRLLFSSVTPILQSPSSSSYRPSLPRADLFLLRHSLQHIHNGHRRCILAADSVHLPQEPRRFRQHHPTD